MQKNWYAVYTKPHCERKVSLLLTRKGIENFCPLNKKRTERLFYNKVRQEPVFKSTVFVRTTATDIVSLNKRVDYILNPLFLRKEPAIINVDEIEAIKEFTDNYQEIELEKLDLNLRSEGNLVDNIIYRIDRNVLTVKSRLIKANLPSLGFTLTAKSRDENIRDRKISFGNKELMVQ